MAGPVAAVARSTDGPRCPSRRTCSRVRDSWMPGRASRGRCRRRCRGRGSRCRHGDRPRAAAPDRPAVIDDCGSIDAPQHKHARRWRERRRWSRLQSRGQKGEHDEKGSQGQERNCQPVRAAARSLEPRQDGGMLSHRRVPVRHRRRGAIRWCASRRAPRPKPTNRCRSVPERAGWRPDAGPRWPARRRRVRGSSVWSRDAPPGPVGQGSSVRGWPGSPPSKRGVAELPRCATRWPASCRRETQPGRPARRNPQGHGQERSRGVPRRRRGRCGG